MAGGAARRRAAVRGGGPLVVERDDGAECVGLYANDTKLPGNALVVVRRREGLLVVAAEKVICANGGASQPLPFPGVDRPGVYAARGLVKLPGAGVRASEKLAVVGERRGSGELRRGVAQGRLRAWRVASSPQRALGESGARRRSRGRLETRCDAVAIALPPAPLHDARHLGRRDRALRRQRVSGPDRRRRPHRRFSGCSRRAPWRESRPSSPATAGRAACL